jgi:hypothetical protein
MDFGQRLLELCTGPGAGLNVLMLLSDLSIAVAYYSIPLIMLWVLRRRHEDLPYAWLWVLFVAFITACGTTHLTHIHSMIAGERSWVDGAARIVTAAASVGTAIAFALALPQIKVLPSPKRQREELERLVRERTAEKDKAILDMYHAVGNILAVAAAAIRLQETRDADQRELRRQALDRIQEIARAHQQISEPHRRTVAVSSFGELVAKEV